MNPLQKYTRPLNSKELKTLAKIRSSREKDLKRNFQWGQPVAAISLGALALYLATWTRYDLFTFLLGTFSVFCVAFVIIRPYEFYKDRKRAGAMKRKVEDVLSAGVLDVTPVSARQVALAKEHEDEGDLYIVETDKGHILYMWDRGYNLKKNFPCLSFEIYSDDFVTLIGRQINPLSEKIKPTLIDPKAKWNYLKKAGSPEHLALEKKNFEKLMEKIAKA